MGGCIHPSVAVPLLGKGPQCLLHWLLCGSHSWSGLWREKSLESNPDLSVVQAITWSLYWMCYRSQYCLCMKLRNQASSDFGRTCWCLWIFLYGISTTVTLQPVTWGPFKPRPLLLALCARRVLIVLRDPWKKIETEDLHLHLSLFAERYVGYFAGDSRIVTSL